MSWFNTGPGLETTHVLANYDWGAIGNGTVVDVGGSNGSVAIAIAQNFPRLSCIVQDRPEVVAEGRSRLSAEVTNLTFMAHDFFAEQPVKGAEVYYFRWIFHDWSDKYAIKILQALIPALKDGSKVVISEYVLPEMGTVSHYQDRGYW